MAIELPSCPKPFCPSDGQRLPHPYFLFGRGSKNLFADPQGGIGGFLNWPITSSAGCYTMRLLLCAPHQPDGQFLSPPQCPPSRSLGATWSPNTISYSGNNRTHAHSDPGCPGPVLNCVLADAAANPYLFGCWSHCRRPGRDPNTNGILAPAVTTTPTPIPSPMPKRLPCSLVEALNHFRPKHPVSAAGWGDPFVNAYLKLKRQTVAGIQPSDHALGSGKNNLGLLAR
jgi:hypothetical protein